MTLYHLADYTRGIAAHHLGAAMRHLTPTVRKRAYEIAVCVLVVAVAYGLVEGDKSDAWLALVAAVLGVARANVND